MKNKTFLTVLSFGMALIFAYPLFPAQPDLKVTKIELVSGCKVRFTFKNIGGPITSPYTFSTQFFKNGSAWGGYSNTQIDPNGNLAQAGGTAQYTRYEGVGGGTHTIGATIDISDQITESDENNNFKEVTLNCTSEPEITPPDFQVANILLNPNCGFAIVLKNGGMEPIPIHEYKRGNGMLIHVTKNGKYYENLWLDQIDPTRKLRQPGGFVKYGFPAPSNPELGNFKIRVFKESVIAPTYEAITSNNSKEKTLLCRMPDLIVMNVGNSPSTIKTGQNVNLIATIKNIGNKASGSLKVKIRGGGESHPPEYPIAGLNPGQTKTINRGIKFDKAGSYKITATADSQNQVKEAKENNNEKFYWAKVYDGVKPDYLVEKIYTVPSAPRKGQPVRIYAVLKRSGIGAIFSSSSPKIGYSFKVGGETRPRTGFVKFTPPLNKKKITRTETFSRSGYYRITVVIDPMNIYPENNETNNTKSFTFRVQ